ncbi:MAG: hypothetical protein U0269_33270 [Polyangiales bacterium]
MQRTNNSNAASTASLSPAFVVMAFLAGVILSAVLFALRGTIATVITSSAALPVACVLGAFVVRAVESLAAMAARSAGVQRKGTA